MRYILLLLIVLFGYQLFFLMPGTHIKGVFRVTDLGLVLIFISLEYYLLNKNTRIVLNKISLMVVLYLVLVLMHVVLAAYYFNQTIISGIIASRHQFYYLSYFVFLFALDNDLKVEKFIRLLTYLAFIVVAAAIVNYAGVTLFYHEMWADGHGERFGITRAFIPGMNIIGLAFIWLLLKYTLTTKNNLGYGIGSLGMIGALFFRQTRGRIIAAVITAGWLLIRERRFKLIGFSVAGIGVLVVAFSMLGTQNLVTSTFKSSYEEISNKEGTWGARTYTLEIAVDEFLKHPILGNGSLVLRTDDGIVDARTRLVAYQGDLGYPHWLKNYGLVGAVWMLGVIWIFFRAIKNRKIKEGCNVITEFGRFQFIHILVSGVTLDYWARPEGIIVLCLVLAIATRKIQRFEEANTKEVPVDVPTSNIIRRKRTV